MQGAKVKKVHEFKFLVSVVQWGVWNRKKRGVQAGWSGWKRVSGVIWDRRVAAKVTENITSLLGNPRGLKVSVV